MSSADPSVCYELTVRNGSHFSQEDSFYRFNSLVDLVIGDYCVSKNRNFSFTESMPSLQTIRIGKNSFCQKNENGHFFIEKQPMLHSLITNSWSFISYTNFCVRNCPKLRHVQIGQIPSEENDWLLNCHQYSFCFQNAQSFELSRKSFYWVRFDQRCPN